MKPQDLVLTSKGVRFHGRVIPCAIGKGGIRSDKREGDGATPTGLHRITQIYYRADRMTQPCSWATRIGAFDLWSDDASDVAYNRRVTAPYGCSHERMRRGDPLYDIVLVTDWNRAPAIPGQGSAIFLHIWRRATFPTEGCIAFSKPNLKWIVSRLEPGSKLWVPERAAHQK